MTRSDWRRAWRLIRIANRESLKACQDLVMYGTCAVQIDDKTGECRHVPIDQIRLPNSDANMTVATLS